LLKIATSLFVSASTTTVLETALASLGMIDVR
jgi:hypothetical protein